MDQPIPELEDEDLELPESSKDKQYNKEIIAMIETLISLKENKSADDQSIEWNYLPDRDELFIQHSLTQSELDLIERLVDKHEDTCLRGNPAIPLGKAIVSEPFDIKLVPKAHDTFQKKKPKPYPLRGTQRDHLRNFFFSYNCILFE